ncbi:MAG TPA: carboxypeptidase regulatory-like domain-containing protein [Hymenobacter sp.]|uniref:carboxypeptidase regulatory-like domain-containing protein n=1 Tax=Hymenobacter sp. TaxID=1898978 RepID=UPI002D80DCCC|nr:carboxypeptidase regulatory-like domain-containing protein [Hymenobacter sp.]HET9504808.1 carboxypeptidase regulatory-like domain-containing protein [Hymenobacter sp.]
MTPRATTLRIPQPCAESWAAMTPAASSRYCATCTKTVVDFTRMTDAEILTYLAQAGRAGTCGRVRADQLARPLRAAAPRQPWRAWLGALLAAISLVPLGGARAAGRTAPPVSLAAPPPGQEPAAPVRLAGPPPSGSYHLEGVVLDSHTNAPIAGATVLLDGSDNQVATDEHGKFVFPIVTTQARIVLLISAVGRETYRQEVALRAKPGPLTIRLATARVFLGGLGLVSPPPTLWQRVSRFFA